MSETTPVLSWVREWWPIVSTLGLAGLGWAMLYLRSQFVTLGHAADLAKDIEALRGELSSFRSRIDRDETKIEQQPTREQFALLATKIERLEMAVQYLPDKDVVHRLEISVAALHGELKEVAAQMKPVGAIADRLQEFLLDQAKHR